MEVTCERWRKLGKMPLGHLAASAQVVIMQELLPMVQCFATSMADVGCVRDYEFEVVLTQDTLEPAAPKR